MGHLGYGIRQSLPWVFCGKHLFCSYVFDEANSGPGKYFIGNMWSFLGDIDIKFECMPIHGSRLAGKNHRLAPLRACLQHCRIFFPTASPKKEKKEEEKRKNRKHLICRFAENCTGFYAFPCWVFTPNVGNYFPQKNIPIRLCYFHGKTVIQLYSKRSWKASTKKGPSHYWLMTRSVRDNGKHVDKFQDL